MVEFTRFEEDLRETIQRLRSPGFLPPESVLAVSGAPGEDRAEGLLRVIQAVKELEPPGDSPADSQLRRIYDFLTMRFVQGMTQEEIAERMHMSVRNVQRIQPEAVHILALHMWQKYRDQGAPAVQAVDWQAQVERELISLDASHPESSADLTLVIEGLMELKDRLFAAYAVEIETGFLQPGITAAAHPSVLRQVLIAVLARLARLAGCRRIEIFTGLENGKVKISIAGQTPITGALKREDLSEGIPIPGGTEIDIVQKDERLFVQIWMPSARQHIVLVVEDNLDVVHYYRRCTSGTNFQLVHLENGAQMMDLVRSIAPEVIVLDVMMPGYDGWQLLTHLHENPETRDIPVIVCSIIREPELALALGAFRCLTKPVKHQQFVDGLNQALGYRLKAGLKPPASSPGSA